VRDEQIIIPRSSECDIRKRADAERIVMGVRYIIHAAARVGGIGYNQKHPGSLFYDNIIMGANLLEASRKAGVEKCLFVGTICSYPKFTPVPFREESLWDGYPEETNAPYGLAKKALLVGAEAYRAEYGLNVAYILPVNLYGPHDTFDEEKSHVIPALIKKVADAQAKGESAINVWGTGRATREFLYVEDAAEGIVAALESYDAADPVNLGSGMEISIKDLVELICKLMDFKGEIYWDATRPDGQLRRRLDVTRAERAFGFRAKTKLEDGLAKMITWYRNRGA
jgi:GDP-L-fucose synthase